MTTAAVYPAEFGAGSLTARCGLAAANALMAAVVGSLTLGIWVGLVGALVFGLLPLFPLLPTAGRAVIDWVIETPAGAALGAFLLGWIIGTVIWGLWFAFGVALVLAPTMLLVVVYLTLGKPIPAGDR